MRKIDVIKKLGIILVILAIGVLPFLSVKFAQAALSSVKVTLSRLKVNTAANHEVKFTTANALTAGNTIKVQWDPPNHCFDLGTLAFADITFTGANLVSTCGGGASEVTVAIDNTAPDENATFTVCTGDTVAAGAKTIVFGNTKITNPSGTSPCVAGQYIVRISTTTDGSADAIVQILSDDQVAVSATVPAFITFSISDNTIGFGTLSSSAARYATGDTNGSDTEVEAHNLQASTNSGSGYTITVNGNTLTYSSYTINAIGCTNTASSPGSEQFGLRMTASGGSGAVSAPYAASGFAFCTTEFPDEVASASSASDTTTYSVRYLANIAGNTEAGIYSATLTYIATGNF